MLDLVATDGFTLIAGPTATAWLDAADACSGDPHARGRRARLRRSRRRTGRAVREIGPDGALLVRPDQHVAWRKRSMPADPAAALASAVRTVLRGG